jgi:hypothetical protein
VVVIRHNDGPAAPSGAAAPSRPSQHRTSPGTSDPRCAASADSHPPTDGGSTRNSGRVCCHAPGREAVDPRGGTRPRSAGQIGEAAPHSSRPSGGGSGGYAAAARVSWRSRCRIVGESSPVCAGRCRLFFVAGAASPGRSEEGVERVEGCGRAVVVAEGRHHLMS